jgi:hypothetical protein
MSHTSANRATDFSTTADAPQLVALNFKAFQKNTLQGFVDLEITEVGLTIHGVCLHLKEGKRWVSLPAKPWTDQDGNQKWQPVLEFTDSDARAAFQAAAIKAIDELRGR